MSIENYSSTTTKPTNKYFIILITAVIAAALTWALLNLFKEEPVTTPDNSLCVGKKPNLPGYVFELKDFRDLNTKEFTIEKCECHPELILALYNDQINPLNNEEKARRKIKPDGGVLGGSPNVNIFYEPNYGVKPGEYKQFPVDASDGNIKVAILDSGLSNGDITFNNTSTDPNCKIWNYSTISGVNDVSDDVGHGTYVASIILGNGLNTNVDVDLMVYKVIDSKGGSLFNGLCAFYSAIKNGANVINLSWGFQDNCNIEQNDLIQNAFDYAKANNVMVVMAAGNDGDDNSDIGHWPSNVYGIKDGGTKVYDNVISVGSSEQINSNSNNHDIVLYSNRGAEYVAIATNGQYDQVTGVDGQGYNVEGTSFSTAKITQRIINALSTQTCSQGQNILNCIQTPPQNDTRLDIGYIY